MAYIALADFKLEIPTASAIYTADMMDIHNQPQQKFKVLMKRLNLYILGCWAKQILWIVL